MYSSSPQQNFHLPDRVLMRLVSKLTPLLFALPAEAAVVLLFAEEEDEPKGPLLLTLLLTLLRRRDESFVRLK
jgi:hypothetical protein